MSEDMQERIYNQGFNDGLNDRPCDPHSVTGSFTGFRQYNDGYRAGSEERDRLDFIAKKRVV